MKSYSQFSESLNDFYLKEWEKLDEDTQKEFIRKFAEENNIELDEALLTGTAIATSPIWGPALKTAAVGGTAYLASKVPGWIQKHNQNKEMERWLETGKFESSNIPKSNRTNKQREETANRENERIKTDNNNNKEEIRNQRESEKINKQLQNRNENPNNPNKKPSNWKKFTNFIKNHPKTSLLGGGLTAYTAGVGLDKAARNSGVIPDNRSNIKNNNNNNNNNNNSNSNTYDPTLDPKNKNKFK